MSLEPKQAHLTVRVTPEERDRLRAAAATDGERLSPWLRVLAIKRADLLEKKAAKRSEGR